MAVLTPMWISQASANQRAGRTGRVAPGVALHMYSSRLYHMMQPYETPELLRVPLDHTVLRVRIMDVGATTVCANQNWFM